MKKRKVLYMKNKLKRIVVFIFNVFLPPRCLICDTIVQDRNGLCPKCFSKVNFLTDRCCPVCGRPYTFPIDEGESLVCGKCLTKPPKFNYSRSVFAYDNFSRGLILPLKHTDSTESVPYLANLLYLRGKDLITKSDILVPVPLHWRRLMKRKYNQSGLLVNALSKLCKKPYLSDVLVRVKNTQSQGHKTRKERQENIKDAFAIRHQEKIKGKTILLVDDVYTTGTTLNECAKLLKENGVKEVNVLTLAKVCRFE